MHIDEFPSCCQIDIIHTFSEYDIDGDLHNCSYDVVYSYVKDRIESYSYPGMFMATTNSSQKKARKALRDLGFKTMKGFQSTWDHKEKVYFHYYRTR